MEVNITGIQRKISNNVIHTIHGTIFSEESMQFVRVSAVTYSAICCFVFILGDRVNTDETIAYVEYCGKCAVRKTKTTCQQTETQM